MSHFSIADSKTPKAIAFAPVCARSPMSARVCVTDRMIFFDVCVCVCVCV